MKAAWAVVYSGGIFILRVTRAFPQTVTGGGEIVFVSKFLKTNKQEAVGKWQEMEGICTNIEIVWRSTDEKSASQKRRT